MTEAEVQAELQRQQAEDVAEAQATLGDKKRRGLPGNHSLPRVPLSGGVAAVWRTPLPPHTPGYDVKDTESGYQASWRQALDQAADSALRLYRGTAYTGVLPKDADTVAAWLEDVRTAECPNAPPADFYSSQCRDYMRSQACLAPQLGWRRSVVDPDELKQGVVILLGGSGSLRYPQKKSPTSVFASMAAWAGWTNVVSLVGAGHTAEHMLDSLRSWRMQHHHLLEPVGDGCYQFPPSIKVVVLDDKNTLVAGAKYTGLTDAARRRYTGLFEELLYFSAVMYGYSNCSAAFRMDRQLDVDALWLRDSAAAYGFHVCSLRAF